MGLTHHWRRPTELPTVAFRAAVKDCQKLLSSATIEIAGFDGTDKPILADGQIVFNGLAPRACEPFEIAAVEFDRRGRDFVFGHCKTQSLPYDLLVKGSLIVFSHHLCDLFSVASDQSEREWDEARRTVESILQYGNEFHLNLF